MMKDLFINKGAEEVMHETKMFSIIVVCLNAGDRLQDTLDSIWKQSYSDYEVIIKDGGSKDGSLSCVPKKDNVHLYREKDTGIYDAMNQAVRYAHGEYLLFLNTGDLFYDEQVLDLGGIY